MMIMMMIMMMMMMMMMMIMMIMIRWSPSRPGDTSPAQRTREADTDTTRDLRWIGDKGHGGE